MAKNKDLINGRATKKELLSVGIDLGTSTMHMIVSSLLLEKNTQLGRWDVVERKAIWLSPIVNTPLEGIGKIDFKKVREILEKWRNETSLKELEIDTGAVIITGMTATRENARTVVEALSMSMGKFVAAVAGPNQESLLSALGSGAVDLSKKLKKPVLNIDIGGGTSNVALAQDGKVKATGCIEVGARLLQWDENNRLVRIEKPMERIFESLHRKHKIGDTILEEEKQSIAEILASTLFAYISGRQTPLTKILEETPLEYSASPRECVLSISGGVGELFYGKTIKTHDLGEALATSINRIALEQGWTIVEPGQKIRATVIGAGMFTLRVSGSTTFRKQNISFPLRNLPVVPVSLGIPLPKAEQIARQILKSLKINDKNTNEAFALYFNDPIAPSYEVLERLAKGIQTVFASRKEPLVAVFRTDIANSAGNVISRSTDLTCPILFIDEITLKEGDYLDIDDPIADKTFPVNVKSLVFLET